MPRKKKAAAEDAADVFVLPDNIADLEAKSEELWTALETETDKTKRIELVKHYNMVADERNKMAGSKILNRIESMGEAPAPAGTTTEAEPEAEQQPPQEGGAKLLIEGEAAAAIEATSSVKVGDTVTAAFAGGLVTGTVTEVLEHSFKMTEPPTKEGEPPTRYAIDKKWVALEGETASMVYARLEAASTQRGKGKGIVPGAKGSTQPSAPKAPRTGSDKPPAEVGELTVMKMTPEIKAILETDKSGADKIREVFDLVTEYNPETKKSKNLAAWNTEDFVKMSGINRSRTQGCIDKFRKQ